MCSSWVERRCPHWPIDYLGYLQRRPDATPSEHRAIARCCSRRLYHSNLPGMFLHCHDKRSAIFSKPLRGS
jgi:hypothetical protein